MRSIVFLEKPLLAPQPGRVRKFEGRGSGPNGQGPVPFEDQFWSLGDDILQDPGAQRLYGGRMCNLIARCLAYVPAHRPKLAQIQREIRRGLAEEPDGDRVARRDVDLFFDPPAPLPAVDPARPSDIDIWA